MTKSTKGSSEESKPQYVADLEAVYGPSSQEGFGSAVFFEVVDKDEDLEKLALKYYKYFTGELWARWGEEAWMTPWKVAYARKKGTKSDVVKELNGIEDFDTQLSVPLILDPAAGADPNPLEAAFNDPSVEEFRAYNIGDGSAMSGLLLVGRRENGEVTVLTALMD